MGHRHRAQPPAGAATPAETSPSCSSRGRDPGRSTTHQQRAGGPRRSAMPWPGPPLGANPRRRRRSSRSSWSELLGSSTRSPRARRRRPGRGSFAGPRHARAAAAAAALRRPATDQPVRRSPATSSSSRAGVEASRPSFPNTVLNTIVAESLERSREADAALKGARRWRRRSSRSSGVLQGTTRKIVFNGDNYRRPWHAEAEKGAGSPTVRTNAGRAPWLVDRQRARCSSSTKGADHGELEPATRVYVEQYSSEG